ncbi:MAG TPA: LamG-like jellyroll fold domain-containing protein [Polyangiaceae bacterium]|jgi:hypothetical protein|nr:LamG-like jellyroll fold domain-containing protein [Polyangiaceae bacterium]
MSRRNWTLVICAMMPLGAFAAAGCDSSGTELPYDLTFDGSLSFDASAPPLDGSPAPDAGSDAAVADATLDSAADAGAIDAAADQAVGDSGIDAAAVGDSGIDAAGEAEAAAVPTPAPDYLWYVLDETDGTIAHDSSPNQFDITNMTGVTWDAGANFDGVSGGGNTTLDSSYRSPPFTISVWLTPQLRTDSPNGHSLQPYPPNAVSDDIPGVGGYSLGLNVWANGSALSAEGLVGCTGSFMCVANALQNANDADGGPSCTSPTSCNQGFVGGQEHFVVMTIEAPADAGVAPEGWVYVDGVLFDQEATNTLSNDPAPLSIGRHNLDTGYGTTGVFDGRIRDVRIYKRQVGIAEIEQLYVNGPTLHAPPRPDAGASDAASE